jgi:hypothetical protein
MCYLSSSLHLGTGRGSAGPLWGGRSSSKAAHGRVLVSQTHWNSKFKILLLESGKFSTTSVRVPFPVLIGYGMHPAQAYKSGCAIWSVGGTLVVSLIHTDVHLQCRHLSENAYSVHTRYSHGYMGAFQVGLSVLKIITQSQGRLLSLPKIGIV